MQLAVTAVYNPHDDCVQLFEMYGQPFGAAHAVPNFYRFYRVAEFLNRVLNRGVRLVIDHFFDDFFMVEVPESAQVSAFCMREVFSLLGFGLDGEKSQPPAPLAEILGVAFSTIALASERLLAVQPKESRRANFGVLVDKILESGLLSPAVAASLLGKYQFLCSTLFGKVGRFCTTYVRPRQYSVGSSEIITPELRLSLKLMKHLVATAPVRKCYFGRQLPPFAPVHGRIRCSGKKSPLHSSGCPH